MALILLVPRQRQVAQPALHFADDVDRLRVRSQALRIWIDAARLDERIGVQRVSPVTELAGDVVLQQPMNEDDIASDELLVSLTFAAGPPVRGG